MTLIELIELLRDEDPNLKVRIRIEDIVADVLDVYEEDGTVYVEAG